MAGIGFELKRLFSRKGLIATLRAYGYATLVCAGPMLLGFTLILGVMLLSEAFGATRHSRELLVSMLTYALLGSLTLTSVFSMLTTRFTADMMYNNERTAIMPSFYGSLSIMLVIGALGYGIFLFFSGVILIYRVLSFVLFMTLIVVWTQINYLTAIKDYRNIMLAFAVGLASAFILGIVLMWVFRIEAVTAMMSAVCVGYGIMMVWYFILLYRYFPEGFGTSFRFLEWIDTNPPLSLIGFFVTVGLFGHLVIMWTSRVRVQVEGLFYGAPVYDVPAIIAFFSILITTVNFTTSVEVRFYPSYRDYFAIFNEGGSIRNIEEGEANMTRILAEELGYLAQKQLLSTLLFIILGTILLPQLPLGFNSEMLNIYRALCVGYAFYAIGNSIMLVSQYFADLRGALLDSAVFVFFSTFVTILLRNGTSALYGFGFILGGALFCIVAWMRLCSYLHKLKFNILSKQAIFYTASEGFFTRLARRLEKRSSGRQWRRREVYDKKHEVVG